MQHERITLGGNQTDPGTMTTLPDRNMYVIYGMFALLLLPPLIQAWQETQPVPILLMVIKEILLVTCAFLQWRGYPTLAVGLLAYSTLASASIFVFSSSQGFHHSATLLFPMVLVLGALMLTQTAYFILAFFVTGCIAGLWVLQKLHIAPLDVSANDGRVLIVLSILAITGIVSRMLVDQIRIHLRSIEESEEHFRTLSNASIEGILIHDQGQILAGNLALLQLFGFQHSADLKGLKVPQQLLTPEGAAQLDSDCESVSLGPLRMSGRRTNGSLFPVEVETRRIQYRGHDARLVKFLDLTAREKEAEARRDSEERYRALFERSMDCVFLTDFNGVFLDANRAALDLLGYSRADIGRIRFDSLLTDAQVPVAQRRLTEIHSTGFQPKPIEYTLRRKDGAFVPVEVQSSVIQRDGVPVAVQGIARNLTERNRAATENLNLQEQLYFANKMESIGRLAGGVAHDFNNLLTVILGYCQVLLTRQHADDRSRQSVVAIQRAAQGAVDLTTQLLTFSRKREHQTDRVELNRAIQDILPMLERLVGEDIVITFVQAEPQALVRANRNHIEQILMNLAANARDAMPDGGALTLTLSVISSRPESEGDAPGNASPAVRLTVADNGVGMSDEVLQNIFEPFFTTKRPGHGTGLGLSIVFGIIRQIGGTISARSQPDDGTVFEIEFPAFQADPDETLPAHQRVGARDEATECSVPRGNETILLVEDREDVRNLTTAMLSDLGYHVLPAETGDEALAIAATYQNSISLLLTDIIMPGMSGRQLNARIRSLCPNIQTMFMSGFDSAAENEGQTISPESFLQKPFTWSELAARIRLMLDATA